MVRDDGDGDDHGVEGYRLRLIVAIGDVVCSATYASSAVEMRVLIVLSIVTSAMGKGGCRGRTEKAVMQSGVELGFLSKDVYSTVPSALGRCC